MERGTDPGSPFRYGIKGRYISRCQTRAQKATPNTSQLQSLRMYYLQLQQKLGLTEASRLRWEDRWRGGRVQLARPSRVDQWRRRERKEGGRKSARRCGWAESVLSAGMLLSLCWEAGGFSGAGRRNIVVRADINLAPNVVNGSERIWTFCKALARLILFKLEFNGIQCDAVQTFCCPDEETSVRREPMTIAKSLLTALLITCIVENK